MHWTRDPNYTYISLMMYAYCFFISSTWRERFGIRNTENIRFHFYLQLQQLQYTSINDDNVSIHNYRKLAPEFKSRYVICIVLLLLVWKHNSYIHIQVECRIIGIGVLYVVPSSPIKYFPLCMYLYAFIQRLVYNHHNRHNRLVNVHEYMHNISCLPYTINLYPKFQGLCIHERSRSGGVTDWKKMKI